VSSAAASEPRPASSGSLTAPCDSEIFSRLRRSRRIWAVAAIHGEKARLQALHRRLAQLLERGDRLVYLGGYLGHGPEVAGTLDELIAFRSLVLARRHAFPGDIAYLRGSQEEMWQKLLQLQFAPNPREVLAWMLERGMAATLAAYGADPRQGMAAAREGALAITRWTSGLRAALDARPGHRQLLTQLKRAALTEEGTLLFVHAGVDPGKPLDLQGDALWWGGANLLELEGPFGGFRRVVGGYDRRHGGFQESPFAASIDGGSGFGGKLLAACFSLAGEMVERIEA
jgi:serine/threonine protein phosphatase 1